MVVWLLSIVFESVAERMSWHTALYWPAHDAGHAANAGIYDLHAVVE
jgi:hypothetical protein